MTLRTATIALALAATAAAPALAAAAPQINVSVNPGTLSFAGAGQRTLTVTNAGDTQSTIDVGVGNYAIAADGQVQVDPVLEPARSAKRWLSVSPSRLSLAAHESALVRVTATPPHIAAPGDHHALVLLTGASDGLAPGAVQVRARVGVGTLVRVSGDLRRLVQVHRLTIHRAGAGRRVLRLGMTNKGNVNERFARGQITVQLRRRGRLVATLSARTRSLLPGTSGIIALPYRGPLAGTFTATAIVRPTAAALMGPGIAGNEAPIVRTATVRL